MAIVLLEYGLKKSPYNNSFRLWLMKLTSKLGLTSMYTIQGLAIKWASSADPPPEEKKAAKPEPKVDYSKETKK